MAEDLSAITVYYDDPEVDVRSICTPLDACVSVEPGPVNPTVLAQLEGPPFDHAPVVEAGTDRPIGLVPTRYLRQLLDAGKPVVSDDPLIRDPVHTVVRRETVTAEHVLSWLVERPAVLVVEELPRTRQASWVGLLTISDLNSHPLRGPLYTLLACLELWLARLVRLHYQNPWDWLTALNEEAQVQILGFWELSKRKGVDVGAVAAVTLPQLINIVARDKNLLQLLGYKSRGDFEGQTGGFAKIRNCVMHPVRPLVLGSDDVPTILERVRTAKDLCKRIGSIVRPMR